METLLARYNKQFASMDSMVGSSNATKSNLTSTFAGMMASYTKN
jgi:flagellar capping protein FliD